MEVLKSVNISKSYKGRMVVKEVNIQVAQGEVVGLLGPNGAGKTTTFYMMVGLIPCDKGAIMLGEKDITDNPLHERALLGIGYLPQEASVFRDLSVEENILSVCECRGLSRSEQREVTENLIQELRLDRIRTSKGKDLSGGERRRVELGRALALSPKYIFLDEPFAGVDPIAVIDIKGIVTELKKKGIGILITDHNVRETLGIVDRAYIMNNGELLLGGKPEDIIQDEKAKQFYLGEEFKL